MKIVQAPDSVLSSKAKPVEKIDKDIKKLLEDMEQTLLSAADPEGVGIAAPQVGKSLQIFLMKPEKDSPVEAVINPVLELLGTPHKKKSKNGGALLEGCLSLKDIWGTVLRYPKVKITYLDAKGKSHTKTVTGWPARIIQHEYDHLQGILFPRRVLEQEGQLYKSHKEDDKDVFEPLTI
ncbi:MAG TPA: peptide deformylase [Patescibacteria group bacterium]|nr:peptide deformylase [Patescibacteria group bacterium]